MGNNMESQSIRELLSGWILAGASLRVLLRLATKAKDTLALAALPRGRPGQPGLKGFRPSLFRKVDVRGVKLSVLVCRIDVK
jgi:hypothetical protein